MNGNNIIYFDSFGVEHVPKEILKIIGNKYIVTIIYGIQAYDLIMYGYFCITIIDFMLKCKLLLYYTNLFSSNVHEKNDKTIVKIFNN